MISTLKLKKYLTVLTFLLITFYILPVKAEANQKNLVNIYFFHSNNCSHCQNEEKFLHRIEEKYPNVKIYCYEIHDNKNKQLMNSIQELYDIKTNGVPLTIIGDTPYIGYIKEKSNLTFIKTIEYYSKYSYIDKIGELLKVETSTHYNEDEQKPTLDKFIDAYGNHKLIGNLYTNKLDLSTSTTILGVLSQLNIIKIISIIIVLISLSQIDGSKNKLLLLIYYIGASFISITAYTISSQIYTLIIEIIILILLILGLLGYTKNKKRQYLYGNIYIAIAIITNYLENNYFNIYPQIFRELIKLHLPTTLETISYYTNYLFTIFIINLLFILIIYSIKK